MAATVTAQLGNPDPLADPTNLQELVTLLNTLSLAVPVSGGPFTPYVISSTTPSVGDQDKAWIQTDGNGRPLAFKLFYSGSWRKIYRGSTAEIKIFSGDPTVYFDGTGLGLSTATEPNWDGFALCNGQNGTPNLSNKFIVAGAIDNVGITGYSGGHWNTSVTGGSVQTGGATTYAIVNTDLPPMDVFISGHNQGSGTSGDSVLVDGSHGAQVKTDPESKAHFGSNPSGTPPVPQTTIPTVPPFYALAYAKFVGYA